MAQTTTILESAVERVRLTCVLRSTVGEDRESMLRAHFRPTFAVVRSHLTGTNATSRNDTNECE